MKAQYKTADFKTRSEAFWAEVGRFLGREPLDKPRSLSGVLDEIKSMHRSIENQAAEDSYHLDRIAREHGMHDD